MKTVRSAWIAAFLLLFLSTTPLLQTDGGEGSETYDPSYLDEKEQQIDRHIQKRNFGRAFHLARKVRKELDDTDLSDRALDMYNSVL